MIVADAVARWLKDKGITHAFGIIGGGNHMLFDAIARLEATQIISCHHEQAAAMASTYFNRCSGTLASVVLCTTGAGSSNAVTGVLAAWMDSAPLLVLSGNEATKYIYKPTRTWGVQGYDSIAMVRNIVKHPSGRMSGIKNFMELMESGYVSAITPRQGPVWMDIPKDVQSMEVEYAV